MTCFLISFMQRFTSSPKKRHLKELPRTSRTTTSMPESAKSLQKKRRAPSPNFHHLTSSFSLFLIPGAVWYCCLLVCLFVFLDWNGWCTADLPELPCSLQLGSSPVTPWWAEESSSSPRAQGLLAPASSPVLQTGCSGHEGRPHRLLQALPQQTSSLLQHTGFPSLGSCWYK